MNFEKLSPNLIPELLAARLNELKTVLGKMQRSVKTPPPGRLRISQKSHYTEFYHITSSSNSRGTYISKSKISLARQLAQKDYDSKIIAALKEEIRATQRYLKQIWGGTGNSQKAFRETKLSHLYTKLCPARQRLITPLTLTDVQYTAQWLSITWQGRPFTEDTPVYTTTRDERVRSKSEVLIADALTRHNIPYRYEYPLQLRRATKDASTITLYPDFLCLNVRTRAEFYWEHLGLMDNPEYSNNAAGKLRLYTENGILAGRNLILTMETQDEPLSTRTVEQLIEAYLT